MLVRYEQVPKEKPILRPQARRHEPEYIRRLSESLAIVQLQPIGLLKDYMVIWGNARVLAARMNPAITHLTAAMFDEEIGEREFQRMRFIENQLRQDLSNAEKCQNAIEYAKSEPDLPLKQIAADLGVDASLMTRWLAWEKCIEPVQQALAADKLTLTSLYAISHVPKEEQVQALALALAAPNAAAVTRAMRKQRNGSDTAQRVKASRIKIELACGVTVVFSAKEAFSLDDAIEAAVEAGKLMKKGQEQGLTAKTIQKVSADRAKAAG